MRLKARFRELNSKPMYLSMQRSLVCKLCLDLKAALRLCMDHTHLDQEVKGSSITPCLLLAAKQVFCFTCTRTYFMCTSEVFFTDNRVKSNKKCLKLEQDYSIRVEDNREKVIFLLTLKKKTFTQFTKANDGKKRTSKHQSTNYNILQCNSSVAGL